VALGNTVAKLLHRGRECDEYIIPVSNAIIEFAKLSAGITPRFIDNLNAQIAMYRSFLGLEARDYPCECPEGIDPKELRVAIVNPGRALIVPPAVDLQGHGITCESLNPGPSPQDINGKYHALLYWASSAPTDGELERCTDIVPAPLSGGAEVAIDRKMPVVLFCSHHDDAVDRPGCTVLNTSFDLRLFEAQMGGLFSGQASGELRQPVSGAA
jgi:hypothetical protein